MDTVPNSPTTSPTSGPVAGPPPAPNPLERLKLGGLFTPPPFNGTYSDGDRMGREQFLRLDRDQLKKYYEEFGHRWPGTYIHPDNDRRHQTLIQGRSWMPRVDGVYSVRDKEWYFGHHIPRFAADIPINNSGGTSTAAVTSQPPVVTDTPNDPSAATSAAAATSPLPPPDVANAPAGVAHIPDDHDYLVALTLRVLKSHKSDSEIKAYIKHRISPGDLACTISKLNTIPEEDPRLGYDRLLDDIQCKLGNEVADKIKEQVNELYNTMKLEESEVTKTLLGIDDGYRAGDVFELTGHNEPLWLVGDAAKKKAKEDSEMGARKVERPPSKYPVGFFDPVRARIQGYNTWKLKKITERRHAEAFISRMHRADLNKMPPPRKRKFVPGNLRPPSSPAVLASPGPSASSVSSPVSGSPNHSSTGGPDNADPKQADEDYDVPALDLSAEIPAPDAMEDIVEVSAPIASAQAPSSACDRTPAPQDIVNAAEAILLKETPGGGSDTPIIEGPSGSSNAPTSPADHAAVPDSISSHKLPPMDLEDNGKSAITLEAMGQVREVPNVKAEILEASLESLSSRPIRPLPRRRRKSDKPTAPTRILPRRDGCKGTQDRPLVKEEEAPKEEETEASVSESISARPIRPLPRRAGNTSTMSRVSCPEIISLDDNAGRSRSKKRVDKGKGRALPLDSTPPSSAPYKVNMRAEASSSASPWTGGDLSEVKKSLFAAVPVQEEHQPVDGQADVSSPPPATPMEPFKLEVPPGPLTIHSVLFGEHRPGGPIPRRPSPPIIDVDTQDPPFGTFVNEPLMSPEEWRAAPVRPINQQKAKLYVPYEWPESVEAFIEKEEANKREHRERLNRNYDFVRILKEDIQHSRYIETVGTKMQSYEPDRWTGKWTQIERPYPEDWRHYDFDVRDLWDFRDPRAEYIARRMLQEAALIANLTSTWDQPSTKPAPEPEASSSRPRGRPLLRGASVLLEWPEYNDERVVKRARYD